MILSNLKVDIYIDPTSDIWDIETSVDIDGQLFRDYLCNSDKKVSCKQAVGQALERLGHHIQCWAQPKCSGCGRPL